jgi:hypothetical protein
VFSSSAVTGTTSRTGSPPIAELLRELPAKTAVLDGEVVASDADGHPNFARPHVRWTRPGTLHLWVRLGGAPCPDVLGASPVSPRAKRTIGSTEGKGAPIRHHRPAGGHPAYG